MDDTLREAKVADTVERLRSVAIAEAEAKKGGAGDAGDADEGSTAVGDACPAGNDAPEDKGVLVAKAKALNIPGVGSHWGIGKLQEAIAEAEGKKGEG